jgi:hypothetical protein
LAVGAGTTTAVAMLGELHSNARDHAFVALTATGECAGDFRQPAAQQAIGVVFEMAAG